jgi:hypothetical protein
LTARQECVFDADFGANYEATADQHRSLSADSRAEVAR